MTSQQSPGGAYRHCDVIFVILQKPFNCLPFKSNESGGKVKLDDSTEVTISSYWNKAHSQLRSRIERKFAHLDKWHILHWCPHHESWLKDALDIMFTFEHFVGVRRGSPYPDNTDNCFVARQVEWARDPNMKCECGMQRDPVKDLRPRMAMDLFTKGYVAKPKNSRKRARDDPEFKSDERPKKVLKAE